MSTCSNQFPSTKVLYDEVSGETTAAVLIGISCVLCVVVLIIFLEEVWYIVHHYPHKTLRNKFICLLGLYPTICITSCLAVLVPRSTLLCDLIASSYLSVCLLLFVNMMVSYFRGTRGLMEAMSEEKLHFGVPPCCCLFLCLNNRPYNKKYFRRVFIMVAQFVFFKPLTVFIVTVLWADDRYTPGDETESKHAAFYNNLVSVISTIVGIWGLSVIFRATSSKLPAYRIRGKFICLQLAIVFLNLQFSIIGILARNDIPACSGTRDSRVRGYSIHHMLLILEMFLVAILARFAYRRLDPELIDSVQIEIDVSKENGNSSVNVQN